jgi:hypothetical protein
MNNLNTPSYQPAPTANTTPMSAPISAPISLPTQKGGRGYKHKRGCKCPLCKKRGGGDIEEDIETGTILKEEGSSNADMKNDFIFAQENEYDDLDAAEKGESGPFKVGGSRKRKHSKKSKKSGKGRKTHRHSRKGKKHGRKTHRRR